MAQVKGRTVFRRGNQSLRSKRLEESLKTLPENYHGWLKTARAFAADNYINADLVTTFTHFAYLKYEADQRRFYSHTKRAFDLIGGITILILVSPLFAACAVAVKVSSPGPIFFKQLRVGQMGELFWIRKFRTMIVGAEKIRTLGAPLEKLQNDPRSTRIGLILRRRKFDELPQLLNVIMGSMSLIGPRPLVIEDTVATPPEYLIRFAVRPGLGGLWQARHPNTISGEKKMRLDCEYVRRRSWLFDIRLFFQSARMFLKGE